MQLIEAIYEQGVFRPLEPVALNEHARVTLTVSGCSLPPVVDTQVIERQRQTLAELRAEMDALPREAPDDGLGGADHDLILYGRQS